MTSPYRAPGPVPLPSKPPLLGWLFGVVLCAALAAFTSSKLHRMQQLRGFSPGIPEELITVIALAREFPDGGEVYTVIKHQRSGTTYEVQRTRQQERLQLSSVVRARCVEDWRECFLPDSVYIDDGNMAFDQGLRVIELLGLGFCLWGTRRRLRERAMLISS